MRSPLKSFCLLLFLILPYLNYSQSNCGCPEYNHLKTQYDNSNDESSSYIQKLKASSNSICLAKSYEWTAIDYLEEKNFDTAEIYFQKAEKIFKQSGCGDSVLLNTYKKWAELNYIKGDFAKTQDYCFKLLKATEASGSAYEQAIAYTMVAQLLNQTGQAEKGIIYSRNAAGLLNKIDNPAHKADVLFKLSKRYLWHYQDIKTITSLDSSELFSIQQLAIAKALNKKNSIASAFSNLEGVAYERNDLKKALAFLDSSFRYTDSSDYATLSTNYYDKADILIELKQYKEAEQMADSSLYYRRLIGHASYIAESYGLLSRIGQLSGDYKKAYDYKESERAILDSVRNVEKTKAVSELEKKYNQTKNEQTIKELAQQKQIYLLLAIAGLLAVIAIGFFVRQQSLKNKQRILETEQRLNRARMNPHFFFNALSSLQTFALQENDGKAIASNLSKFSHIMRETLESTYKEYITIEQEIDFLNEYLALQLIRYPGKFSYKIKTADELEIDDLAIPSMIIQPFAENSIEHGFAAINYPGHIDISFNMNKDQLIVEVKDNGKGLLSTKDNSDHISRATQIIKDRIYLLNSKLKTRAGFSVDNIENGQGVVVMIHLPLLYKENINA